MRKLVKEVGRCAVSAAPGCQPSGPQPATPSSQSGIPNAVGEIVDRIVGLGAERERRNVILWLSSQGLDGVAPALESSRLRQLLWAALHPWRFYRAATIANLVIQINRGDHASGIEAASADETRSGSAEGESPAPEGGDAR
jgi:hypothetical protein